MTTFYSFSSRAEFISAGGKPESEYITDKSISVSVIGERYEESQEPVDLDASSGESLGEGEELVQAERTVVSFLVNTSKPIEEWEQYECWPESPMRIFG